jgi:hypothetical protein
MNTAIPKEEISRRIGNLQVRLASEGRRHCSIMQSMAYYSGSRQNSVLWVPGDGAPVLMVKRATALPGRRADWKISVLSFQQGSPWIFGDRTKKKKKVGFTFDVLPVQHFNFSESSGSEFADILQLTVSFVRLARMGTGTDASKRRMLSDVFSRIPEFQTRHAGDRSGLGIRI